MTISYIHFETKDNFFESLAEAVDSEDDLDTVFHRLIASKRIHNSFTVNDVALLMLLGTPKFTLLEVEVKNEVENKSQKSSSELEESDVEKYAFLISTKNWIDGRESAEEEFRLIPKYSSLVHSVWSKHVLKNAEIIPKIFSDDPFEYLASFYSQFDENRNSPYLGELGAHWENCIESIVSDHPGREMQTLKMMTDYYFGKKSINSLPVKDLNSMLDYEMTSEKLPSTRVGKYAYDPYAYHPIIDPELCVYVQAVLSATYHWVEDGCFDNEVPTEFKLEDIEDFYRKLSWLVNRINRNNSFPAVWESAAYLKLRSGLKMHMMFNFSDYLYAFNNYGSFLDKSINKSLVSALMEFEVSQGFRGSSLIYTTDLLDFDTPNTDIYQTLHAAYGDSGDNLVFHWLDAEKLEKVLETLCNFGQYKVADAILTCWIYVCAFDMRLSLNRCHFLFKPEFTRLLQGKFFPEIIGLLNSLDNSHPISVSASPFLDNINHLAQPADSPSDFKLQFWVDELYSPEDLERRLIELISKEIWEKLDDKTKKELLTAERLFEDMRIRSKKDSDDTPERGFFIHYGVILEQELRLILDSILKKLEEHFAIPKKDEENKLPFLHLQKVITKRNYTQGFLVNLIKERKNKNKLREFPELLDVLEESEIVKTVFNDKSLRRGFGAFAEKYRNTAAHSGNEPLTFEDALEVRGLIFGQDLLRKLFKCRIFHPIELT